jgi:hypothetical protein
LADRRRRPLLGPDLAQRPRGRAGGTLEIGPARPRKLSGPDFERAPIALQHTFEGPAGHDARGPDDSIRNALIDPGGTHDLLKLSREIVAAPSVLLRGR